ncbi:hypothetical protein ACFXK0_16910 [Nocardia sp. NPDC059177]
MKHGAPQRQSNKSSRATAVARTESTSATIAGYRAMADLRFAH